MATFTSNLGHFQGASKRALAKAGEIIGGMAESRAKEYLTIQKAVDTGNLRNSVSHAVREEDGKTVVIIGTNVYYGP